MRRGATVKLTITGATLTQPLELTDAVLLASSSVYGGSFLGTPSVQPDPSLLRYRVSFHVQPPLWMKRGVEVKYVVVYAKNAKTRAGGCPIVSRARARLDNDGRRSDGDDYAPQAPALAMQCPSPPNTTP